MIQSGVSAGEILLQSSPAAPIWMADTGNLLKCALSQPDQWREGKEEQVDGRKGGFL